MSLRPMELQLHSNGWIRGFPKSAPSGMRMGPKRLRGWHQFRSSHPSISNPVCWQARSTISPDALASSTAS